MAWLAIADQRVTAESGLTRYLEEIRRVPMLEPQDEFMLAKRWREHDDHEAAHKLVNSHLRLVTRIATDYRGYGLPISELISEGNVGLMQAVKRFEPERGFRLATYAMWWIKAAIQEYILRSWSLVKMGTTANQKKLFFNLRKAKSKISALEEGDLRPDQVKLIARRLGVTEQDVVDMNRRLGGDVIEVRAFEKVQKSVKNGVAVMEAPALCRRISFQPCLVMGKLPIDVSPRVCCTATG